jgi:hypothetical protein
VQLAARGVCFSGSAGGEKTRKLIEGCEMFQNFKVKQVGGFNVRCQDLRRMLGMMTGSSSSSRRKKEDKKDGTFADKSRK